MRSVAYILLTICIACHGDIDSDREAVTAAVGDNDSADAIQQQPQGSLPEDHEKITFSTYAEVTAADVVEVVLLVDSDLFEENKKQLAEAIDALLKPIINSHWRIAVSDIELATYPTSFITKYANYANYSKQFVAALGVGKEDETPSTQVQPSVSRPQRSQPVTLRAFIIVTTKSLADTKLEDNKFILAEAETVPLTKVYAILNTEEGLDDYLNWKNAQGQHVLSRYGSLQANYKRALEEFSADVANTLRGVFVAPPLPASAVQAALMTGGANQAGEDVAIAQIKVFNAPEGKEEQKGFINDSHYQVNKRKIFTRAKLSEGICVDVTLAK